MSMDANFEVKSTQSVGAGAQSSTVTSTEKTQNTVFEGGTVKKAKVLTEKELKYLVSQGLDVNQMSDEEIQKALEPLYSAETKQPEVLKSQPETIAAKNSKSAVSEFEVDFNNDELRTAGFNPEVTNVSACDFEGLSNQEKEQLFIKSLAKIFVGEGWDSMTPREQKLAMKNVEAQIIEAVPEYKTLNAKQKMALGESFLVGSEAGDKYRYGGDISDENLNAVAKLSFNEQVKNTINKIKLDDKKLSYDDQEKAFQAGYDVNNENYIEQQYEDLKRKSESGQEMSEYEQDYYKVLSNMKVLNKGKSLGGIKDFEFNPDRENSSYELMKKDEHYSEVYKNAYDGIHKNGLKKKEAEDQARLIATEDYLKHQIEGLSEEERKKFFAEILKNCSDIKQAGLFLQAASNLQGLKEHAVGNDCHAKIAVATASASEDAETQTDMTEMVAVSIEDNNISTETQQNILETVPVIYEDDAVVESTNTLNRVADAEVVVAATTHNLENGLYKPEHQYEIMTDSVKHPEAYKDGKGEVIATGMAKVIGLADDNVETEISDAYIEYAKTTKSENVASGLAEGVNLYSEKNQTHVYNNVMDASKEFDKEAAIRIQTVLADEIPECYESNQLEMHKTILGSEYSEIQERAAANIQNYSVSVQSQAIDAVFETQNVEAIEAVYNNLLTTSPEVINTEVPRLIGELLLEQALKNDKPNAKIMESKLTTKDLMLMSPQERREFFVKQFSSCSPDKKFQIMMKIAGSSATYGKFIYSAIARFFKPLLKSMVDRGMGETMLSVPGLSQDVVTEIVSSMKTSTSGSVIQQVKELKTQSKYEKYFESEKTKIQEKVAKSGVLATDPLAATVENEMKALFGSKKVKKGALIDIKQ